MVLGLSSLTASRSSPRALTKSGTTSTTDSLSTSTSTSMPLRMSAHLTYTACTTPALPSTGRGMAPLNLALLPSRRLEMVHECTMRRSNIRQRKIPTGHRSRKLVSVARPSGRFRTCRLESWRVLLQAATRLWRLTHLNISITSEPCSHRQKKVHSVMFSEDASE